MNELVRSAITGEAPPCERSLPEKRTSNLNHEAFMKIAIDIANKEVDLLYPDTEVHKENRRIAFNRIRAKEYRAMTQY